MRTRHLVVGFALAMAVACSGGNPAGPSGSENPSGDGAGGGAGNPGCTGPVTALINGQPWAACRNFLAFNSADTGFFGWAARNDNGLQFGFAVPNRVGTFGLASGMNGDIIQHPELHFWIALYATGGDGTVTVTTFDPVRKRAAGTFTFTMAPVADTGATGEKVVTQGVFDFTYVDQ